ncbi:uncharacterized protein RSE6_01496 [Rhynchosporium secalis]|uniref:Uncharacterized protein n=1 Tax=Rhynchosporium secalis TaxID=38038 RepID=A0A1E1LY15_RHYSE|nr:uncharacterized protein RSE6_01496 [Rhynchosporium secalis]
MPAASPQNIEPAFTPEARARQLKYSRAFCHHSAVSIPPMPLQGAVAATDNTGRITTADRLIPQSYINDHGHAYYQSQGQINHPSISREDSTPHSLRRSTHDAENDIHVDVTPTAVIEERLRATARALEEVAVDAEQYVWKEKDRLKPSPPAKSVSLDTMHSAGSGWNKKN